MEDGLFDAILDLCVAPGKMCVGEMHHIDMSGGAGKDSEGTASGSTTTIAGSRAATKPSGATFPASGRPRQGSVQPEGMMPRDQNMSRGGVNQRQPRPIKGKATPCPAATGHPPRPS